MTTLSETMAMEHAEAAAKQRAASTMSKPQRDLYWQLWYRVCRLTGWKPRDETTRHNCVADILEASDGEAKPFAEFSQPDFGVVKFAFGELAAGRIPSPDQLKQVRQNERRKNLIFVIGRLMDRYGRASAWTLLRNRFNLSFMEEMETRELDGPNGLEAVRQTLTARTYQRRG